MNTFEQQTLFPAAELYLIKGFMTAQGIAPKSWLLGTGISESDLNADNRLISMHQFDMIYRNLYRLSEGDSVGLRFGKTLNISRWGLLSSALLSAPTLAHALLTANHFRSLLRSRFDHTPYAEGNWVHIEIKKKPSSRYPINAAYTHEITIASLQRNISDLLGEPFAFSQIDLAYAAPDYADEYQQHLNAEVRFSQPTTRLTMSKETFQRPLALSNPVVENQAKQAAKIELHRIETALKQDLKWLIKDQLAHAPTPSPSLDYIAQKLGFTPRTLRRKLKNTGDSFRHLLQQHQLENALQLLTRRDMTVDQIARRCGFSEAASFRLAFKRWTQVTPQQYRQQCRE